MAKNILLYIIYIKEEKKIKKSKKYFKKSLDIEKLIMYNR